MAVAFWLFGASVGFIFDGAHGAAIGLAVTTGLSYLASIREALKR
jgi:hypothetical protein